MDIESLRATLEQAGAASLLVGFLAGFLFSFNPVAVAAIPVSLAYVTMLLELLFLGLFRRRDEFTFKDEVSV